MIEAKTTMLPNTTNATLPPPDDHPLSLVVLLVGMLLYIILIGLCLTYIIVVLRTPKLRDDHAKWLQLAVASSILLDSSVDILYVIAEVTHLHHAYLIQGVCQVFLPVIWATAFLNVLGMVAVTIERLMSLWRGNDRVAGFGQTLTLVIIAGLTFISWATPIAFIYGFGGVHVRYNGRYGIYSCEGTPTAHIILMLLLGLDSPALFLINFLLIGRLCKSQRCDAEPYEVGKIIHVIISNFILVFSDALVVIARDITGSRFGVGPFVLIAIMLLWLLADSTVRKPLRAMCCPCCPHAPQDDDRLDLVVNYSAVYEDTVSPHCWPVPGTNRIIRPYVVKFENNLTRWCPLLRCWNMCILEPCYFRDHNSPIPVTTSCITPSSK